MKHLAMCLLSLAACAPRVGPVPVAAASSAPRVASAASTNVCASACAHYRELGCAEGDRADCPLLLGDAPPICTEVASAASVGALCRLGVACTLPSPAAFLADVPVSQAGCR